MSEPNPMINAAVSQARGAARDWQFQVLLNLHMAKDTDYGQKMLVANPAVQDLEKRLMVLNVSEDERVRIIGELEELHTFSGIINRTRRRDIASFTLRRAIPREIAFTEPQRQLHDSLLKVQAEIFAEVHGSLNVKFMMTTIRRQAASCLFGLAPFIEDILSRHVTDEELSEVDIDGCQPDPSELKTIGEKVRAVVAMAKKLDSRDSKLEEVLSIVRQMQCGSGNHRVMIFSSFRHTLQYLLAGLEKTGVRVGLVHGGVADVDRTAFKQRFEMERSAPDALDVLLFSEVGCEGLDYQFCDCMINYDLPWNPMRVEQRIGRIDRNGQKSEFVTIYNLITPGTVDADIYERCLLRIGIFEQALGASEEILGKISTDIQEIAINPSLTEEERREKLQQLGDNEIRLIQEEQRLEDQQLALFGINLPTERRFAEDVENASSFWLSPSAMGNLLDHYLSSVGESGAVLGEGTLKTLRVNQVTRARMLADARELPGKVSSLQREWERWLKGSNPHLPITFDGQCANDNRAAHLLTPVHPVIRQAAKLLDSEGKSEVHLMIHHNQCPQGIHAFAVFQWEMIGLRRDLTLVAVALDGDVNENLLTLLPLAQDCSNASDRTLSPAQIDALESLHYHRWDDALAKYRTQVIGLAKFKEQSLKASHDGRMALLKDQLQSAPEDRIRRMRQAQIDAALRDFDQRSELLRVASIQADITTERIIIGTIDIRNEQ